MATEKSLQLTILTQEKELLSREVISVTVTTTEGEITVLPNHIPLFTKIGLGELVFRWRDGAGKPVQSESFAVSGGFLDVNPDGEISVLADHAIRSADIDLATAEAAKEQAERAMQEKESTQDFLAAESSLRRALNDLKVANKRRGKNSPQI